MSRRLTYDLAAHRRSIGPALARASVTPGEGKMKGHIDTTLVGATAVGAKPRSRNAPRALESAHTLRKKRRPYDGDAQRYGDSRGSGAGLSASVRCDDRARDGLRA